MTLGINNYQYTKVCKNSYQYNKILNDSIQLTEDACKSAIAHLDDCIRNSTIGLVARRTCQKDDLNWCYLFNEKEFLSYPKSKAKNDVFESQLNQNYPKTRDLRESLIYQKRVVFDKVTPKMTKLQKVAFRFLNLV